MPKKKKLTQVGWMCESCTSPGSCFVIEKDPKLVTAKPWGCPYQNDFTKQSWKKLYGTNLKAKT